MPNFLSHRIALLWVLTFAFTAVASAQETSFELRDGDRDVLLGNSFFERAIDYGVIETDWLTRWPEREISFRNVGWDGDTVYGHSRAGGRRRAVFGNAEEGFQRMLTHVQSLKPTVIVLAYGFNESFDGAVGEAKFEAGLRRLISELGAAGKVRFVLLSTTQLRANVRDKETSIGTAIEKHLAERNKQLDGYNQIMRKVAHELRHPFVDLSGLFSKSGEELTENGIHLNRFGYERVAEVTAEQLELPDKKVTDSSRVQNIRRAVAKKNRLYFHRWRPRNDAFVYGERKDEQKIAQTEPEKFEPVVSKQEEAIRALLQ